MRFDLLNEYTAIAAPRFSKARDRIPDRPVIEQPRRSPGLNSWQYAAPAIVAIVALAFVAF